MEKPLGQLFHPVVTGLARVLEDSLHVGPKRLIAPAEPGRPFGAK
jgi:hypothetical protein